MLRSGLALAGARAWQVEGWGPPEGCDNGIVTALDLMSLDLHGTEPVVFPACNSGLGDHPCGQGVAGLGRAVVGLRLIIGARSCYMV